MFILNIDCVHNLIKIIPNDFYCNIWLCQIFVSMLRFQSEFKVSIWNSTDLKFERYFNQMMTNNWTYVFHAALSVQSKCFHIRADSHIVDIALAITKCILFVWNICGQNQAAKIYCRLYAEHFIIVLLNIIPVISRSTTSHFISIANVCY